MSFVLYDLLFLAFFTIITVVFLYKRRKNLKRQGILYLYPTKFGVNLIDKTAKKYEKILRPMQYVVITSGYLLMAGVLWMLAKVSYTYLTSPTVARDLKVPVIMPLIPYLPELFKLDFLPSFYFTYWILIIAIIAIPHEFAHGIFARLHKITVHSTGFGFLGPFLAAFVEPDEKQMQKLPKIPQMAILASGTFANVLSTIFFGIILWLFFMTAFAPVGVYFDSYSTSIVNVSELDYIDGVPLNIVQFTDLTNKTLIELKSNNISYYTTPAALINSLSQGQNLVGAYDNSPAFNAKLEGAITHIDEEKITSYDELRNKLSSYSPGDNITIKSLVNGQEKLFEIELGERNSKSFLGIGKTDLSTVRDRSFTNKVMFYFYEFIDPLKYNQLTKGLEYQSTIGDLGLFIYDLLWWTVLICFSVALVNMLPLGIFDGGRFFYLTVFGITKNEKIAKRAFSSSTWLLLALVAALMVKWLLAII